MGGGGGGGGVVSRSTEASQPLRLFTGYYRTQDAAERSPHPYEHGTELEHLNQYVTKGWKTDGMGVHRHQAVLG